MAFKIAVVGASGAIGGYVATALAAAGADVTAVVRDGLAADAIAKRGLSVERPQNVLSASIKVSAPGEVLPPQDAIVVSVKAHALESVLPTIIANTAPRIIQINNGIPWWYFASHGGELDNRRLDRLDPRRALWSNMGPDRIIGGVIYANCTVVEPGRVRVATGGDRLILGRPAADMIDPLLTKLSEIVTPTGLAVETTTEIRDAIWQKLLNNLPAGLLGMLSRGTAQQICSSAIGQELINTLMREGAEIAHVLGRSVTPDPSWHIAKGQTSKHKASILQDLELGRPVELDAIYLAVLDLAQMTGIRVPTLDMLTRLAVLQATNLGLYPIQDAPSQRRPA